MSIKEEALTLKPLERLHLIDELLLSLDIPIKGIDEKWAKEAEERIVAYDNGHIDAIPASKVFAKYTH